jgi:2-oxo-4-hydroxy-4-carboxy--5-ureidoimidazoline (OHCU) decarboxylase
MSAETVAKWMIDHSYATGHGDTIEDLLKELEWQIRESEREACVALVEAYIVPGIAREMARIIRSRGNE